MSEIGPDTRFLLHLGTALFAAGAALLPVAAWLAMALVGVD